MVVEPSLFVESPWTRKARLGAGSSDQELRLGAGRSDPPQEAAEAFQPARDRPRLSGPGSQPQPRPGRPADSDRQRPVRTGNGLSESAELSCWRAWPPPFDETLAIVCPHEPAPTSQNVPPGLCC